MRKKITLNAGRKLELIARECSAFQKFSGLMFKNKENAEALLFTFDKDTNIAIHSFFVFFPFYAVWLDENNKIIDLKKVKPFTLHIKPKKRFKRLLEIPINNKYKEFLELLNSKV